MDTTTGQSKNTDSQFISFHDDFPPTSHADNAVGQLDTGASVIHQPFSNLSNDSTGIGIIEDLQGIHDSKGQGSIMSLSLLRNVKSDTVIKMRRILFSDNLQFLSFFFFYQVPSSIISGQSSIIKSSSMSMQMTFLNDSSVP